MEATGPIREVGVRSVLKLIGLVVLVCLAGCSSGKATSSSRSTVSTAPSALSNREVLRRVSFQAGDLHSGYLPRLFHAGDDVAGQVTLDLCGSNFPSEPRRSARHQVGVADSHQSDTGVSIEAVLYDVPDGATQAMREVRAAKANCPNGYVRGDVAGVPPLRYRFSAAPDTTWTRTAGVDRFAVEATVNDQQGHTEHDLVIYQQRGRVLVGLYTADPTTTARALTRSVEAFTQALAQRMAALPSSAVAA
jgi:hypothetical protein